MIDIDDVLGLQDPDNCYAKFLEQSHTALPTSKADSETRPATSDISEIVVLGGETPTASAHNTPDGSLECTVPRPRARLRSISLSAAVFKTTSKKSLSKSGLAKRQESLTGIDIAGIIGMGEAPNHFKTMSENGVVMVNVTSTVPVKANHSVMDINDITELGSSSSLNLAQEKAIPRSFTISQGMKISRSVAKFSQYLSRATTITSKNNLSIGTTGIESSSHSDINDIILIGSAKILIANVAYEAHSRDIDSVIKKGDEKEA